MAEKKQNPVSDNERWLSDGNCAYCRRYSYCRKPCMAQRHRKAAILQEFIRNKTGINAVRAAMEKGAGE